jgi:hypothetical protein
MAGSLDLGQLVTTSGTLRQGKLLDNLNETNHIIMTMGIHSTIPPLISICLVQTY